jgi:hypothetical protein
MVCTGQLIIAMLPIQGFRHWMATAITKVDSMAMASSPRAHGNNDPDRPIAESGSSCTSRILGDKD